VGGGTQRTIIFCGKLNFILSFVYPEHPFILSALNAATYIFTGPTYSSTIITFNPFTLNAEFQHFIKRFNKFHHFADATERGDKGLKGGPKTE